MSKALLYDSTLCIGCKSCESAGGGSASPFRRLLAAEFRVVSEIPRHAEADVAC